MLTELSFCAFIEKNICCFINNILRVGRLHTAVITVHPTPSGCQEGGVMTATQTPHMICYGVQIIFVWGRLGSGIVQRDSRHTTSHSFLVNTRWEGRWHIVGKIKPFERKVDGGINLVRPTPFERKTFQVDDKYWWESREGERFGGLAESFAVRATPSFCLLHHFRLDKGIQTLL